VAAPRSVHSTRAAERFGWTAFKFQGDGVPVAADPQFEEPGHDRYTRGLTNKDIRRIVKGMDAVDHLESLRRQGADYLLVPCTSLWWLVEYAAFGHHLRENYRVVHYDADCFALFDLSEPIESSTSSNIMEQAR